MRDSKKLWGGRFSKTTDDLMTRFSASVEFDRRLYKYDIVGSLAHAKMLSGVKILSQEDYNSIKKGLEEIRSDIENGKFQWSDEHEDVHMNIEAELINRIGDVGKKLHTGRSRNDQVATDMRLYLREHLDGLCISLTDLQRVLINTAAQEVKTLLPGLTHMQSAQPVTLGHHLLAWNEMLQRDYERFRDSRTRLNTCPLGSAALAGTSFPIDREMTAKELGFEKISANSLDAVSDRDFVIEFLANASILMVHLSRISEELIIWSSELFGFVDLGDAFCTGSSIMPQKKNPDVAELTRGKTGRVSGNLVSLLMLMKGQPLAYNRDNQEDKEPLFDTVDTLEICLGVFTAMFSGISFNKANMLAALEKGYPTATDLADYLVKKDIPFRDAHEIVGMVVSFAIENEVGLQEIELDRLQEFSSVFDADVYQVLDLQGSVKARDQIGGTAPKRVKQAVKNALKLLDARKAISR